MAGSPDSEHAAFLSALRALLPDDGLLTQSEDLHPYECDGLSVLRELPLAVVLPVIEQRYRLF